MEDNTLNEDFFADVPVETVETDDPFSGDDFFEEPKGEEVDEGKEVETEPILEEKKVVKRSSTPKKEETANKIEVAKKMLEFIADRKGIKEDVDWDEIKTEDDIADLLEAIDEFDQQASLEKVKSNNTDLAKVIEILEKGGDKKAIASILAEQQELESFDINTESGAKKMLKQYYKNVIGLAEDRVDKKIDSLESRGLLADEAEDILPLYQESLHKKQEKVLEQANKEQEKQERIREQKRAYFAQDIQTRKIPKMVGQQIMGVAFGERTLDDGSKVNEMDYRYNVLKDNPQFAIKLAEFLVNPNDYDKRVQQAPLNKKVVETTNNRLNLSGSKELDVNKKTETRTNKFTF